MTDHAHIYDNGHCTTCYEREDAVVVKLDFLRDRTATSNATTRDSSGLWNLTVEAIDLARRTIAQLHEDEANDRMLRAEWDDGAA